MSGRPAPSARVVTARGADSEPYAHRGTQPKRKIDSPPRVSLSFSLSLSEWNT